MEDGFGWCMMLHILPKIRTLTPDTSFKVDALFVYEYRLIQVTD